MVSTSTVVARIEGESIKTWSAYRLADHMRLGAPDSPQSPGAAFLRDVRDRLVETIEYLVPDSHDTVAEAARYIMEGDDIHEIADAAVPVYTLDTFRTFTDLAAWEYDVQEYINAEELAKRSNPALIVAERSLYCVAYDLLDTLCGSLVNEED